MADDGETLFYDMWHRPPGNEPNNVYLRRMLDENAITIERWETQPIADQIKLHGCRNVPAELPAGLERRHLVGDA